MRLMRPWELFAVSTCLAAAALSQPVDPPRIDLVVTNNQKVIQLPIEPSVEEFQILQSTDPGKPFAPSAAPIKSYQWKEAVAGPLGFYQLRKTMVSSNDLLTGVVLNRLAYGPTPDELERVKAMGPGAYINEQLAPESITESLDIDQPASGTDWRFVKVTGTVSSSTLYIYLTGLGDCYLDDIQLVKGSAAATGQNFLKDGSFDITTAGPGLISTNWTISTNLAPSERVDDSVKVGTSALHLISTSPGDTRGTAIWQDFTGLKTGETVTLSYWYKPGTNLLSGLVVRLSGSGVVAAPDSLATRLYNGQGVLDDLRAWHMQHAVRSKRQLLETMLQFLDNHFVTQVSKTRDYFDQFYNDFPATLERVSVGTEFNEIQRWRQALLKPQTTFEDLLKISAESPAMIIYLDTVNSRGDGKNIANENYAREILELFTFGVDNGYDQTDITTLSRVWTGWTLNIVDPTNEFNPFAPRSTKLLPGGTNVATINNLEGVWAFRFRSDRHNTAAKTLFRSKTVPARFGPPWAGRSYQLDIPAITGTNGISEGYTVVSHLANQPFTEEFISVKLCRLFVHDEFELGYDFTDPNLSAEGRLVRDCMLAWENATPKGNLRTVLKVIFDSDLFRSNGSDMHKIKTPMEYVASAVRALRSESPDGTATAQTDGYALKDPMNRMGGMRLFDRAAPDGYPETAGGWISVGTLGERLRFAQALLIASGQDGRADAGSSTSNPVALIKKKLASAQWNDAGAVTDYILSILFPGEGRANLADYRANAVAFLNTADDGVTASPFSGLSNTTAAYDTRLRGMIGMLMTTQRFQEQ